MSKTMAALSDHFNGKKTVVLKVIEEECHLADVEDFADQGPICAKLVSDKFGISLEKSNHYLRRLARSGALTKSKNKMRIGGEMHIIYQTSESIPRQVRLIDDTPPARDWLVAAFFGERTCVTP